MITKLFNFSDFLPHEHCFAGNQVALFFYAIGNLGIFIAYMLIPFYLYRFIKKHKESLGMYDLVFKLFIIFISSCGITHLLALIGIWFPFYRLEAIWSILTATVSISTIFVLKKLTNEVIVKKYWLKDRNVDIVEVELPPVKK